MAALASKQLTRRQSFSWRRARLVAAAALSLSIAVIGVGSALGSVAGLPNPCTVVPSAEVATALGLKRAPSARLSAVNTTATCSYGASLTLFVGYKAVVNPAPPAQVATVPGLAHGYYLTFKGSTQTEVTFLYGSTASGVYGVVRNYVKVTKSRLEQIARVLYAGVSGASGSPGAPPPAVHLVSG